mmetsp:Transcript_42721/g.91627  ORF Transcript_42721/g.91627 Transcript_42721/m.91627 type:complete len:548 (-) Transcript_42721:35-1678(-)
MLDKVYVSVHTTFIKRPVSLELNAEDTVAELKSNIRTRFRVHAQEQLLSLQGKNRPLDDDAEQLWNLAAHGHDQVTLQVDLQIHPLDLLFSYGGRATAGGSFPALSVACGHDGKTYGGDYQFPTDDTGYMLCQCTKWDTHQCLTGGWDRSLKKWDLLNCQYEESNERACGIRCIAADWSASRFLTGGEDGYIRLWDFDHMQCLHWFSGHLRAVYCLELDWNNQRFLSGSQDKTLRLWTIGSGVEVQVLRGHHGTVLCMSADWNHSVAVSGAWDCTLRLWDLRRAVLQQTLSGSESPIKAVKMSWTEDVRTAVSCGEDDVIHIWDLITGSALRKFSIDPGPAASKMSTDKAGGLQCMEVDWKTRRFMTGSRDGSLHLGFFPIDGSPTSQPVKIANSESLVQDIQCLQVRWTCTIKHESAAPSPAKAAPATSAPRVGGCGRGGGGDRPLPIGSPGLSSSSSSMPSTMLPLNPMNAAGRASATVGLPPLASPPGNAGGSSSGGGGRSAPPPPVPPAGARAPSQVHTPAASPTSAPSPAPTTVPMLSLAPR